MLEGLEVSVINLQDVLLDSFDFRIDSEYFKKEYLLLNTFYKNKELKSIGSIAKVSDGDHSKFPQNQKNEIRYLQAKDIKNHFIEDYNPIYVSEKYFAKNRRSHVKQENIILSIMGSVGDIAIIPEGFKPSLANRAVAIIKDIDVLSPYYLFSYLSTKYGQLQIERQKNGGVQERINLDLLSRIHIPLTNTDFQFRVKEIVKLSQKTRAESKNHYSFAENLLLRELGLDNFNLNTDFTNIKNFKDSFGISGRLDAEYYQKKYDQLEGKLNLFECKKLNEIVKYPISSGITPKAGGDDYSTSEEGIAFIRAVDLEDGQVVISNVNYIKPKIHEGVLKRTKLLKNDVLFSIAGTVGRTAIFNHNIEANINQAVAILRFDENEINRLYLIVFYNSPIGKEFISKYSRQGLQTNLNLTELGELYIPLIDFNKQKEIAQLVENSFAMKKESERLLEVTKRAVEIAVEENEEVALKYISDNTHLPEN